MIAQSVAEIVSRHVKLTVEGIDRMYLNVFVPGLQYEQGIVRFFREHRGQPLPSAALMSPMTRRFVAQLEDFVSERQIPVVQFCKGQRKDEVMAEHLRRLRLPGRRSAPASCGLVRPRSGSNHPGRSDLPTAPTSPPRLD